MIIECYQCQASVDAKVVGEHQARDEEDPDVFNSYLLECPRCRTTLLGGQYVFESSPLCQYE